MSEKDMLLVLGASYDDREEAERDYEAIKALYRDVGVTHDFDAAVLERDDEGEVHVLKKHEQPTRHGAARGLGWGLAIGAATAIFPANHGPRSNRQRKTPRLSRRVQNLTRSRRSRQPSPSSHRWPRPRTRRMSNRAGREA